MTEKMATPDEADRFYALFTRIATALERIASSSVVVDTRAGTVTVTTSTYTQVAEPEAKTPQAAPLPERAPDPTGVPAMLEADIQREERVRELLGGDLHARLLRLEPDTQDPEVARAVRPALAAHRGLPRFEEAKDRAGIVPGQCPTAKQLRQVARELVS